ncbi:MAG: hypothetical protein JWR78_896 [Mycobacterium sp.]|nr:hypothetical protein [Mycobacterium sp.]
MPQSALWRVCSVRPGGRQFEGHPAVLSVASLLCDGKTSRSLVLGDGPGGAGVGQAHRDEAAQVKCGGAVM